MEATEDLLPSITLQQTEALHIVLLDQVFSTAQITQLFTSIEDLLTS